MEILVGNGPYNGPFVPRSLCFPRFGRSISVRGPSGAGRGVGFGGAWTVEPTVGPFATHPGTSEQAMARAGSREGVERTKDRRRRGRRQVTSKRDGAGRAPEPARKQPPSDCGKPSRPQVGSVIGCEAPTGRPRGDVCAVTGARSGRDSRRGREAQRATATLAGTRCRRARRGQHRPVPTTSACTARATAAAHRSPVERARPDRPLRSTGRVERARRSARRRASPRHPPRSGAERGQRCPSGRCRQRSSIRSRKEPRRPLLLRPRGRRRLVVPPTTCRSGDWDRRCDCTA